MQVSQSDLFERPRVLPEGLKYQRELISPAAEHRLMQSFETLPFREFEFQGFLGKRRVVSFGWRYDFNGRGLGKAEPIPEILLPIRERAAQFAAIQADMLEHVLLTEYRAGATIGWHKDRKSFDDVIGVSFGAPCQFRLRRKQGAGWERVSFTAKPRSIYLLRGPARTEWEHSIPAADGLRYSITFRSLKHS